MTDVSLASFDVHKTTISFWLLCNLVMKMFHLTVVIKLCKTPLYAVLRCIIS